MRSTVREPHRAPAIRKTSPAGTHRKTWWSVRCFLSNSVVAGNNFGLSAGSLGQIVSYGNNMFNGNFREGAVTSTVPTE
jgi:hypothetical protein